MDLKQLVEKWRKQAQRIDDGSVLSAASKVVAIGHLHNCADELSALLASEGEPQDLDGDPVHGWFELSYAQYLTVPRSVLQSMPLEWQRRFVRCLRELDDAIDWRPKQGQYWVQLRAAPKDGSEHGRGVLMHDPFMDYQRGRRRIALRERGQK